MVEGNNTNQIRVAHLNAYGFEVTEKFANDLAVYARNPAKTPSMLASGDAQQVIDTIKEIYGVRVSQEYANDLLAFAERSGDK